ncbi:unnamed protein product [Onchocerca flexuosa]|uniref:Uncharacterized protein n=1 Tax=Onchocerca flexuosa TaxID=387005 RepID=A0A183H383_9BILA|nr:unnamed protein product [Onchocerca flexuosa]
MGGVGVCEWWLRDRVGVIGGPCFVVFHSV